MWLARYPYIAEDTQWGKRYLEWWPNKLAPENHAEMLGAGFAGGHSGPFGMREHVGPWNRQNPPLGWQHTGTCHIEEHDADLNIFDASILEGTEDNMAATLETIQARVDEIRWHQAVNHKLETQALVLESAATTIRLGEELTLDEASAVTLIAASRTQN